MIILATSVLFHVCAVHGVMWEGVGAAWMLSAFMDAALIAFAIYSFAR